jgi:hypothetical protein
MVPLLMKIHEVGFGEGDADGSVGLVGVDPIMGELG